VNEKVQTENKEEKSINRRDLKRTTLQILMIILLLSGSVWFLMKLGLDFSSATTYTFIMGCLVSIPVISGAFPSPSKNNEYSVEGFIVEAQRLKAKSGVDIYSTDPSASAALIAEELGNRFGPYFDESAENKMKSELEALIKPNKAPSIKGERE